LASAILRVICR